MPENPFAPHSPATAANFVDREREIDLIFSHIKATQRGNVAVNGPLGIGKTSVLRFIADATVSAAYGVTTPEYAVVYVDTHSVTPFTADRFWRRVGQLLGRQTQLDLARPLSQLMNRTTIDVIDLEEFLDELADRGTALVLLLDEFEWALQADTPEASLTSRNFLAQMASLARRTPRVLSLVVTTDAPLVDATRSIEAWRGSPFPTVFTTISLKPLGMEDAEHLLTGALDGHTVQFTAPDRARLFAISGGHPSALQAAAFSLYHGYELRLDEHSRWSAAEGAAERALDIAPPHDEPWSGGSDAAEGQAHAGSNGTGEGQGPSASGLWIDAKTGEVYIDGRRADSLTALEYSLLRLLYSNLGKLVSKQDIIQHVWGTEFLGDVDESRVEKLVSRLRRKIEKSANRPQYVRTVRGRGYRFVP